MGITNNDREGGNLVQALFTPPDVWMAFAKFNQARAGSAASSTFAQPFSFLACSSHRTEAGLGHTLESDVVTPESGLFLKLIYWLIRSFESVAKKVQVRSREFTSVSMRQQHPSSVQEQVRISSARHTRSILFHRAQGKQKHGRPEPYRYWPTSALQGHDVLLHAIAKLTMSI